MEMEEKKKTSSQFKMETDEENCGSVSLKRQREPLLDSEDNVLSAPGIGDAEKRRRLEAVGQENRSPVPSSSGRLAELEMKPDTPMVPSVQSRIQLLAQKRDGAPVAHPCLSDPGAVHPSFITQTKAIRVQLLAQGEFNQRMERFKAPASETTPSSGSSCPQTRSNFVSNIQQKLQSTPTSSSKQATQMRHEREMELSMLPFQSISENAWLKRNSSDSSLTQQVDSDAETTEGSFSEALATDAEKPPAEMTGESEVFASSAELEGSHKAPCGEVVGDQQELSTSTVNEQKYHVFEQPENLTSLKLSFSDDQSLSEFPAAEKQAFLESTTLAESDSEETEVTKKSDEMFTFDKEETMDSFSFGEEEMELSTDEELKVWRYPQGKVLKDEESTEGEKYEESLILDEAKSRCANLSAPTDIQDDRLCPLAENEEDEKPRPEEEKFESEIHVDDSVKDDYDDDQGGMESGEGCSEDRLAGDNVLTTLSVTNGSQSLIGIQASDPQEIQQRSDNGRLEVGDKLTAGKVSKKVSFILEPELINSSAFTESESSVESRAETSLSDCGQSSHDETNTAEIIDQMFEEVLDYAGKVENGRRLNEDGTDCDNSVVSCSGGKEVEEKKREEAEARGEVCDQGKKLESSEDDLLTFPAAGILSPLSKSVEAVVTPLRLAATVESNPSSLLLTPNDTSTPPAESAPLYSIDAYRSQRQRKPPTIQSVTPVVQRRAPDTSKPQTSANTKEEIAALNEEAAKLQTVINQTLQALNCCTDEEHGRGSLEEAEAEKLLLVSCEKHSALLAEVARLRRERSSESEEADYISQQPCRGTFSITNIQLPLKVEFVCSSHNRTGRPSHYFFVLIRYGPHNIVATPLATAADALNGDAISFPTSVTLKDIRASFEIDVEVYSLTHTPGTTCSTDRATTRSRVTPRKLLNTITRSSHSQTSSAPSARRSSNFCLVGSHKITLASLGQSKFPLDKMKFEGKIRRLLGDEFQEKVPFLSPLEGNIYLQLDSESHSVIQYQGFLTMFDLISGFGLWHRRYFVLEGCNMHYWNHPNDRETKEAEGSIALSRSPSQCVRSVKRDSCARPFTFELVSNVAQDQNQEAFSKCWFSADTKQERLDWIESLNQALLDFHTWNRTQSSSQQTKTSSCGNLRESML